MARTRVKSSNIENNTIKSEDISSEGLDSSKISTVDASSLISGGVLPQLDASQLTNILNSLSDNSITTDKIADNSITADKISIDNDGTAGQALMKNSSGNLEFGDVSVDSDPTLGGDLSGTVSNAQINNGVIDDSKISSVDASKITGTLPHGVSSGGALGSLHESSWADDTKVTVNLTNSSTGIGNAVVKVYEEISGQSGLVNNTSWDINTNDQRFDLQSYTLGGITITPAATTGESVEFTFNNYVGNSGETDFFGSGPYKNGVGYKITKLNGTGIARVISTSGSVATCKIEEDFNDTSDLVPGAYKFEAGEFVDGNYQLCNTQVTNNEIQAYYGLGEDIGGRSFITTGGGGTTPLADSSFFKMVRISDARALVLMTRVGTDANFNSNNDQFTLRVIQYDPNSTQGSPPFTEDQEYFFSSTIASGNFPLFLSSSMTQEITEVDIAYFPDRGAVIAGRNQDGRGVAVAAQVPSDDSTSPQTINVDPTNQISFAFAAVGTICKDVKIDAMSDKHFLVTWLEQVDYSDGGTGFVPKGRTGYIQTSGAISYGSEFTMLGNLISSTYDNSAAGQVNEPLLKFFDRAGSRKDFVYIYYRDSGSPYAIHGAITNFDASLEQPNGSYSPVIQLSPNQGCFKDSNGVLQPNLSAGNRISTVNKKYSHWLDCLSDTKLVYFWNDSTLGIQAACISLAPTRTDGDSSQTALPLYIGEYNDGQSINIKGGPAQRMDINVTTGVGAMSGCVNNKTLRTGFYQWSNHTGGVPVGEVASEVKYGTFEENNTIISGTPFSAYNASGAVPGHGVVQINNDRMFSAHHHGDHNFYARIYNFSSSSNTYVTGEFVTAISGFNIIDISGSQNISMSVTRNNFTSSFYSFCDNPILGTGFQSNEIVSGTFFITRLDLPRRNIATSLSSIHGGNEGDWYYNNGSSYETDDWVRALGNNYLPLNIDKNSAQVAIMMALDENFNFSDMSPSHVEQAGVVGINGAPPTFTWPTTDKLAIAITLKTFSSDTSPNVDKVTVNYDGNSKHRDKTHEYIIDIVDVNTIEVTSPSSGGPRNARIYVSS